MLLLSKGSLEVENFGMGLWVSVSNFQWVGLWLVDLLEYYPVEFNHSSLLRNSFIDKKENPQLAGKVPIRYKIMTKLKSAVAHWQFYDRKNPGSVEIFLSYTIFFFHEWTGDKNGEVLERKVKGRSLNKLLLCRSSWRELLLAKSCKERCPMLQFCTRMIS